LIAIGIAIVIVRGVSQRAVGLGLKKDSLAAMISVLFSRSALY
jgi:hypothetical protein